MREGQVYLTEELRWLAGTKLAYKLRIWPEMHGGGYIYADVFKKNYNDQWDK